MGSEGTILKTTDGGTSWLQQTSGTTECLNLVDYIGANTATVVGGNSTILRTTDGGTNWSSQSSALSGEWLYGVDFIDSNNGYAVGG